MGAHILTDIATEDLAAHTLHERGVDGALVLDGEVADATRRVHLIRRGKRAGGACFETARAGAATIRDG